ncbi:MAG TPA: hypothetical protein VMH90_06190 [Thermoplasmata archaeon]|nr:hypothetical protein [Thermoplasmata archaeon]
MKFWIWAALLKAAALRHRDPAHRDQLLRLAAELKALDAAAPSR